MIIVIYFMLGDGVTGKKFTMKIDAFITCFENNISPHKRITNINFTPSGVCFFSGLGNVAVMATANGQGDINRSYTIDAPLNALENFIATIKKTSKKDRKNDSLDIEERFFIYFEAEPITNNNTASNSESDNQNENKEENKGDDCILKISLFDSGRNVENLDLFAEEKTDLTPVVSVSFIAKEEINGRLNTLLDSIIEAKNNAKNSENIADTINFEKSTAIPISAIAELAKMLKSRSINSTKSLPDFESVSVVRIKPDRTTKTTYYVQEERLSAALVTVKYIICVVETKKNHSQYGENPFILTQDDKIRNETTLKSENLRSHNKQQD